MNKQNKALSERIAETEAKMKKGLAVRVLRKGKEVKLGVVTKVLGHGAYIHSPKRHANDGQADPADCAEWFAFRSYEDGTLCGGIIAGR